MCISCPGPRRQNDSDQGRSWVDSAGRERISTGEHMRGGVPRHSAAEQARLDG
jgi:hypothetical protein